MRHMYPQLMIPSIMFSIVVITSSANGPLLPTMPIAYTFIKSLLKAIFLGLGVATGVSLIVVPIASQTLVKKLFTGHLTLLQNTLKAHKVFINSLEDKEAISDLMIVDKGLRKEV